MNWPRRAAPRGGRVTSPTRAACGFTDGLDLDVVAGSAVEDVLPSAADQHVIARTAEQGVVTGTTNQDIGTVAAVLGDQNAGREPGRVDDIITAKTIDDDAIIGVEAGDRNVRSQTWTP